MLKRGNWSVIELERLRTCFGRRPLGQLARDMRRSPEAIVERARRLFEGDQKSGDFKSDELADLRRMVGIADLETMALVLRREADVILDRLREFSLAARKGRWAAWELEYLRECWSSRADWAVQLVLGRKPDAIQRKADEFCLGKDRRIEMVRIDELETVVTIQAQPSRRMPRWSADEVEQLRAIYPSQPNLAVAKMLGRSVKSVLSKANELGLKKSEDRLRSMGRENVELRYHRRRPRG